MRTSAATVVLCVAAAAVSCSAREQPAPPTPAPAVSAAAVTDARFAIMLSILVDDAGLVRYARLDDPKTRSRLQQVVDGYAATPLPAAKADRMALWCNAYNANVVLHVDAARRKPGFVNVVEVPGFFKVMKIRVAGETLTLNDLENERIRPLGDARIHAVLVCAAMSCPPLRNEPIDATRLDAQFDDQCRRWVNDPAANGVDGGRVSASRILEWYGSDFAGPPYGGVAGFLKRYADPDGPLGTLLAREPDPPVVYREYDWSLNISR